MNRRKIAFILLGIVFLTGLLACGYFGVKIRRRVRLRHAAMTAYEKKDYEQAERLLLQYVQLDPDSEAEYAALANIYRESGNAELEAQMWQMASSLNPQNQEYRENMLNNAIRSANYALLHNLLGRKAILGEEFTDHELYLYVISGYRPGYSKNGDDAYQKATERNPEAFHKDDLGRMAEFLATYETRNYIEREAFLNSAMQSADPVVQFEALYSALRNMEQNGGDDPDDDEKTEKLLKQAAKVNYLAGTAMLADYFFSKGKFAETINVLEPYLKSIDDIDLYLMYAESCVFEGKLDELKALEKKLRKKSGVLPFMADYCDILIAYLENDIKKLSVEVRRNGKRIDSPLSRFIRLRVAMSHSSFDEIRSVAQDLFSNPPFYDLHTRALFICLDYIEEEMKKPENRKDPSRMADLAKILSGYLHGNRLLTEIILLEQYQKELVKEEYLLASLEHYPDNVLLQRITAEFLIFQGKANKALPIIEQLLDSEKTAGRQPDCEIRILSMLALDQVGRQEEAADIFRELVVFSEFDPELLRQYFLFCVNNKRTEDLASMADKLDALKDEKLEQFGLFFRAAAMLQTGDESKEKEALDLLASTPDDAPDFTFYAANCLSRYDRLDEAEAKYKAILKTYHTPSLPYVNLSDIYHAKGEEQKALEAAKTAFELEKESLLPAFIYAKRLSEAERFEDAVEVLHFPHHEVDYREDIVNLWRDCMYHVIEKSFTDRKYLQAEAQCNHLLIILPDDEFGKKNLEKARKILIPRD